MPQESISIRPAPVPPALSGDSVRLPQRLFLYLFWSTWVRERLLILMPALVVLRFGLWLLGSFLPIFDLREDGEGGWFHWHYMLPFVPSSTRLAVGLSRWLGYGWPVLLLLVVVVLLLPTAIRRQVRARFPAEALPDLTCLRLSHRPAFALTSVAFVVVVGLLLCHAFLGPLMIEIS